MSIFFAFLTIHDCERTFAMFARNVREKGTGEKCTEQDGCARVRSNAYKRGQHQHHENDVGEVVVPCEMVFNISTKNGSKEELGDNGCNNGHGSRRNDWPPYQPTKIYISSALEAA